MFDAALEHASRRVSVFPVWYAEDACCGCGAHDCESPGKHPIARCAPNGLKDATTDEATIIRWWTLFPRANIATRTGITRTVLDIDPGKGGRASLAQFETQHGPLPTTAKILTGGGGEHYHFAPVPGLRNSAGKVGSGLDIRAEGGYVLLPPSNHVSGGTYLDDLLAPMYDTPLAPMPEWLIALAQAPAMSNGNGHHATSDEWAAMLTGAPEGQRREMAAKVAGHFLSLLGPAREGEVLEILRGFAARCTPPFPEHEARELVRNLARRDLRRDEEHRAAGERTSTPAPAAPYSFTSTVPAGHFLADYIAYAATRTDAPHEIREAAGLVVLAAATPNVRVMLSPYPGGLPTNLYVLIVGESTSTRKSTAKAIAHDLLDAVIPSGALADMTSPEAFIEQLARRSGDSGTWDVDEIGDLLDKMHHAKHMAGLRGLLLTVYDGRDYRYSRHSKRTKGGTATADDDVITQPHLSILGATTPSVFDVLTGADVRSGLLPRFAVIMPTGKPPRAPFYGSEGLTKAGAPHSRRRCTGSTRGRAPHRGLSPSRPARWKPSTASRRPSKGRRPDWTRRRARCCTGWPP